MPNFLQLRMKASADHADNNNRQTKPLAFQLHLCYTNPKHFRHMTEMKRYLPNTHFAASIWAEQTYLHMQCTMVGSAEACHKRR